MKKEDSKRLKSILIGYGVCVIIICMYPYLVRLIVGGPQTHDRSLRQLNALKIAYRRYQSIYDKVPKNLEAMLSTSTENPQKRLFYDCDEIPVDLYSETPYKIIPHVKEITQSKEYEVTAYTTDPAAQNLIIYSVGKNGQDDHGLFDPDTNKDDIALFVQMDSHTKTSTPSTK